MFTSFVYPAYLLASRDPFESLESNPVTMMFTDSFRFNTAYSIDVIPFFISVGLSLSRLFVLQCINH